MIRAYRIPRSPEEQFRALDDNLFLVREYLEGARKDAAHFKTLFASLRTLICLSSGTEGLLWRLAEDLGVSDELALHVFGGVKADHPHAVGLRLGILPLVRVGEGPPNMPSTVDSLREVVKKADQVFFAGKGFTYEYVIKSLAQQEGLAHESEDRELLLAELDRYGGLGRFAQNRSTVTLCELVLQIGERILCCAEKSHGYRRKPRLGRGDFSLVLLVGFREDLCGRLRLFSTTSHISEVTIECSALPGSLEFQITKQDQRVATLFAKYPPNWPNGVPATFCFRYSSMRRRASTIVEAEEGQEIVCDIGWAECPEFVRPHLDKNVRDFVTLKAAMQGEYFCWGDCQSLFLRRA